MQFNIPTRVELANISPHPPSKLPLTEHLTAFFFLSLLNPAVYHINHSISSMFPDSIAYITLAKNMLNNGALALKGWGHVDNGVILSPFYPFLIGIVRLFRDDGFLAAQYISNISMILAPFAMYTCLRYHTGRFTAFFTVLLIQLNFFYLYYALSPLTEAIFLLLIVCGFLLVYAISKKDSPKTSYFLLGVNSSLIALTRQIGIVFFISILIYLTYQYRNKISKHNLFKLLYLVLGFIFLFLPYNLIIYNYTNHSFLTQIYRMNKYTVSANVYTIASAQHADDDQYKTIIENRRKNYELTPDAAEMYGELLADKTNKDPGISVKKIQAKGSLLLNNITGNTMHMVTAIGYIFIGLFLLSSILSCNDPSHSGKAIIPLFIILYFVSVSTFTDTIQRYIAIVFPLLIMQIPIGFSQTTHVIAKLLVTKRTTLITTLLFSLGILFTPHLFTEAVIIPKVQESHALLQKCKGIVSDNDPVFCFHPGISYQTGGVFRIMPHGSIRNITIYASKTGVKWLAFAETAGQRDELEYAHSRLKYEYKDLDNLYPNFFDKSCKIDDVLYLYRFRNLKN